MENEKALNVPSILDGAELNTTMDMTENTSEQAQAALESAVTGAIPYTQSPTMDLRKTRPLIRTYKKTYRNDPCPCGSGKKYKKCCLESGKYEELKEKPKKKKSA